MEKDTNHSQTNDVIIEEAETVKVSPGSANNKTLSMPAAIVVGFALIAAAIYFGGAKAPTGTGGTTNTPSLPFASPGDTAGASDGSIVQVTAGDLPTLGDPNAKVLMVEWGDYQCPFCERFFQQVEPTLREQYIKTGKVRFAFRDFQFLGQESTDAGIAARCANEQGKFWEYHDKLFKEQKGENQGTFAKANLKKFAVDLGLDTAKFNICLDSDKYKDAVEKDAAAGRDAGVSGTPTTFINGRVVNGAQPLANFTKIIDEELSK